MLVVLTFLIFVMITPVALCALADLNARVPHLQYAVGDLLMAFRPFMILCFVKKCSSSIPWRANQSLLRNRRFILTIPVVQPAAAV